MSVGFLLCLASVTYGIAIGRYRIFPYEEIKYVKDEIKFVISDFLGGIDRLTVESTSRTRRDFRVIEPRDKFGVSAPIISLEGHLDGYTAILGTFDFGEISHGVILLDSEGAVIKTWTLNENSISHRDKRSDGHKFPSLGFAGRATRIPKIASNTG